MSHIRERDDTRPTMRSTAVLDRNPSWHWTGTLRGTGQEPFVALHPSMEMRCDAPRMMNVEFEKDRRNRR